MTTRLKAPYKDLTRFELNRRFFEYDYLRTCFCSLSWTPFELERGLNKHSFEKMHFCKAPQMKNHLDSWIVQFSVHHLVCVLCVCVCVCVCRACVHTCVCVWYERSRSPPINSRYSRKHYCPWCVNLCADGLTDEPCAWRSNSFGKYSFCRGSRRSHMTLQNASLLPSIHQEDAQGFTASFQRHCVWCWLGWEIWVEIWVDREQVGAREQ